MHIAMVAAAAFLVAVRPPLSVPVSQASADVPGLLARKGPAVVRCADGLLAINTADASAAGATITLKKNAVTARLPGEFAAHPHKPQLAELLLIAMENVAALPDGKLVSGAATIAVTRQKAPSTCDVAEIVSAPYAAEYDKPLTVRQMNFGGRPNAILNLRYLKKQPKRTTQTCVISDLTADVNEPLQPELRGPFMEDLAARQKKWFTTVVTNLSASPGSDYELRLHVLGSGVMDGEGRVAFISFEVVDHAIGKAVTYGRGFRQIGTKPEKDVRDFATFVACL